MGYNKGQFVFLCAGNIMDQQMRTLAELAARLVLQSFQAACPQWDEDGAQTPIDTLVEWLGLSVETFHPEDYPAGTHGFVDPDEDEHLIWLRRDLPETFRRFTLAHELGHAVLHCRPAPKIQAILNRLAAEGMQAGLALPELSREDPCHETDVQENLALDEDDFQETLGIGQSYDPRSQRELAANIFASELLMPLERVQALYLVDRVPPNTLAATFAVSNAAMLNRLAGLLKHPPSLSLSTDEAKSEQGIALPAPVQAKDYTKEGEGTPAKKPYDEFQQAAIQAATPALIVAGPGSGKTSTLIGRAEYLVHEQGIPAQHILALTFSRKAAQEMEERLQLALGAEARSLPKVSTFHAFCADLLRQHGALVGLRGDFMLIDEAEGYFILRHQAPRMRLQHYQKLQAPAYYFPDLLKAISRARDELLSPHEYKKFAARMKEQARNEEAVQQAERALEVAQVYELYQEELERRGDTDFGGLLMLAVRLLREHPAVLEEQQEQFQHILVDEFQDMNRASGVLLRELAGTRRQVWVVGDANQAIYGFRGASPANISQFEQDFPGAVVLPLARNYRSRPDLVWLAESFRCRQLELGEEPGKNQAVRLTNPEAYVTLARALDDQSEMAGMVEDMRRKHASGYAYHDMIVLTRTRAQAQKISRVLATAGLPVVERGGMLEQEHTKDLLSILLLLTDPGGMGLMRAARQAEHPLSQDDLEALLLAAREQKVGLRTLLLNGELPPALSPEGQRSLLRLMEILRSLLRAPDAWSVLAQYLLIETSLGRDLLCRNAEKQSNTILADYDALLQVARHYDLQRILRAARYEQSESEQSPLQEHLKGFLEYLSLLVLLRQDGGSAKGQEGDGEEAEIIRVMTVHASKGLEFPLVYMPGLVQRRFPLQARANPVPAPVGMLPPESEGSAAHESGESCLFYVGVTRARDQLILSYSERYGRQKYKRSPYLDALEAGLDDGRITKLVWESKRPSDEQAEEVDSVVVSSQPGEAFIKAMKPVELSVSAIEAYQRCPRQYAYSTVYRFKGDEDAYQLFWQATQRTVEALQTQLQDVKNGDHHTLHAPSRQEIQELYTQHWQTLGGHTSPFAALYEQHGHEIVESIRRTLVTQQEVAWKTRPAYDVEIAGRKVNVTIDRVEASQQAGEPVKFVRARYGKRKEKPSAETRELLYTMAYRKQHPGQNVELHSHNMSTGEIVPITMTPKKEQSLYDEIERSIQAMERNEFPAQPAEPFRCPTCPFFIICPA